MTEHYAMPLNVNRGKVKRLAYRRLELHRRLTETEGLAKNNFKLFKQSVAMHMKVLYPHLDSGTDNHTILSGHIQRTSLRNSRIRISTEKSI